MKKTGMKVTIGSPQYAEGPKAVHVEKIKNGYVVRTCGMGQEESQFVQDLAKTPEIMSRLLGVKGKSARDLEKMTEVGEEEEES